MRAFHKLFGIGLSRTGTTSLTAALKLLQIPTKHWPLQMTDFHQFTATTDLTVACRFEELDRLFPGSLFIYTERDLAGWLPSVMQHYRKIAQGTSSLHRLPPEKKRFARDADRRIYGGEAPTEADFRRAYQAHHENVLQYFAGREDHLLRMNIMQGAGWDALGAFLQTPPPSPPFPWLNSSRRKHGDAARP